MATNSLTGANIIYIKNIPNSRKNVFFWRGGGGGGGGGAAPPKFHDMYLETNYRHLA